MTTPWRTRTVLQLCEAMREARDYSAAPILADALQDADYPHAHELAALRSGDAPAWALEMLVAGVYTDEGRAAVQRVADLAVNLGPGGYPGDLPALSYQDLMRAAHAYVTTGDDGLGDGSMNWSNEMMDCERQFWADFTLITGRPGKDLGEHGWSDFLSCSC